MSVKTKSSTHQEDQCLSIFQASPSGGGAAAPLLVPLSRPQLWVGSHHPFIRINPRRLWEKFQDISPKNAFFQAHGVARGKKFNTPS